MLLDPKEFLVFVSLREESQAKYEFSEFIPFFVYFCALNYLHDVPSRKRFFGVENKHGKMLMRRN